MKQYIAPSVEIVKFHNTQIIAISMPIYDEMVDDYQNREIILDSLE